MSVSEITNRIVSGKLITYSDGVEIDSVDLSDNIGVRRVGGQKGGVTFGPVHILNPNTKEYVLIESSKPSVNTSIVENSSPLASPSYKLITSPDPSELPIPKVLSFDGIEEGEDDREKVRQTGRR